MATFMFTKRLWKQLGAPTRLEAITEESENRLGSFCLDSVETPLGERVLAVSQTTRLCVVLPLLHPLPLSALLPAILFRLVDELVRLGIPEELIKEELFALEDARFGKNTDRSLLGSTGDLLFFCQSYAEEAVEEGKGLSLLQEKLNRIPHTKQKPPFPEDAVRMVFGMYH